MIEVDVGQMENIERLLGHIPGAVPKAVSRAINRAIDSVKTEAARKVRETYYIKNKDIMDTVKVKKSSPSDLMAEFVSRGSAMPVIKFQVNPKKPQPKRKKQIIVRVKRGEGGTIMGAFVAKMRNGRIGVYNRVGRARFPIVERYGPAVPQMLGEDGVREYIESKAQETLEKRLDHEIDRLLGDN